MYQLIRHGKIKKMKNGKPFVYSDFRIASIAANLFYTLDKQIWEVVIVL